MTFVGESGKDNSSNNFEQQIAGLKAQNEQRRLDLARQKIPEIEADIATVDQRFEKYDRERGGEYLERKWNKKLGWAFKPQGMFYVDGENNNSYDVTVEIPPKYDEERTENYRGYKARLKQLYEHNQVEGNKILLQALQGAIQRYQALVRKVKLNDRTHFHLEIISQTQSFNSPMMGGDLVTMSFDDHRELIEAWLSKNYQKFLEISARLQSQYFHEFTHHLSDEDDLDNGTHEELTMLTEFLYDPLFNVERNNEVFGKLGKYIFDEHLSDQDLSGNAYFTEYRDVTSKILLYELVKRDLIKPPFSPERIRMILINMGEFYGAVSEEERNKIIEKYVPMKRDALYELAGKISTDLGLPY